MLNMGNVKAGVKPSWNLKNWLFGGSVGSSDPVGIEAITIWPGKIPSFPNGTFT
jgi:hypothetical protein